MVDLFQKGLGILYELAVVAVAAKLNRGMAIRIGYSLSSVKDKVTHDTFRFLERWTSPLLFEPISRPDLRWRFKRAILVSATIIPAPGGEASAS